MTLGKDHILLSIYTEGVWSVPLKTFYTKDIFGLDPEMFYFLSCTNKSFFTLYIVVQIFMTNLYNLLTDKKLLMMMGVLFFQNKMLESFIVKNITRNMLIRVFF